MRVQRHLTEYRRMPIHDQKMKYIKKSWLWLGTAHNHNASMVVITAVAVIFALPYFSRQINNIQVKVDSLGESVKNIYGHYVRETFCPKSKDSFKKDGNGQNVVEIALKYQPVENSVNVWEGTLNVAPIYFSIHGKMLELQTNFNANHMGRDCLDWGGYVVTYIPNPD